MISRLADRPVHPIADLFPQMSDADYEAFKEDIREHGVLEPVVIWKGMLVDGRNRVRAATELGLAKVPHREERCSEQDLPRRLMSLNVHRRHLTTAERAIIAAQMANMRSGERTDLPPRGGRSAKPLISQTNAAKVMGVGTTSIDRASRLLRTGSPDLIRSVREGRLALTTADRALKSKQKGPHALSSRRGRAIRRTVVVDSRALASLEGSCNAFAALDFSQLSAAAKVEAVAVLTRVIQRLVQIRKRIQ